MDKQVKDTLRSVIKLMEKGEENLTLFRVVPLLNVKWANALTEKVENIKNMFVLGFQSSGRPLVLTYYKIWDKDIYEEYTYRIIEGVYSHCNFSSFPESRCFKNLQGDGKHLPKNFDIIFYGQEFCNPITAMHVLEGEPKDMATLLKINMSSQNFDDSYSSVESVCNGETDLVVKDSIYSQMLMKSNSSPLEWLLGLRASSIRCLDNLKLNEQLRKLVSLEKNQVYAKYKSETKYKLVSKTTIRRKPDEFSKYYPIFTYNDIQKMITDIPKDNFDLSVYGLGSAGTAILDQVCRANWFKTIFLCDFDDVEAKNMINQWYFDCDINLNKTTASVSRIEHLGRPSDKVSNVQEHKMITRKCADKFQLSNPEQRVSKYLVSGFDSIKARQEFLEYIMDGRMEGKYLIDCRYLDLACSIYFVDLENKEEVEFYKANLDADGELITKQILAKKLTKEEFIEWCERKSFISCCLRNSREYFGDVHISCEGCCCRDYNCYQVLYNRYLASLPNDKVSVNDASCVKYNYIDIYKYVGAIVFGAIRRIENGDKKPFTLIEAQTDVNGLPNYMVVRS